ncbi:nucleopolyhedrovirus P10 family protein [Streptomyces sp. CB01635]|uniref:Asp23/Gls24 family envelope stress response protein n=1 Tax=unclassified Streptomyces TaxID=2593676 RepID=UPI000C27D7D6|nr:Asp23/Gls24 family envelope stress response protein [Streptomyces sp. CB01635]PJN12899.1 nucleopolyhedrovirus P10 family protein [Streptomyces sp. CB01635]
MSADRWTQAVRHQLGLGRLVPLGGPRDGCWLAESAARSALRQAVQSVHGVRLGSLRVELADPDGSYESAVPAPPSALPPGPLRIVAECAAAPDEPLPTAASRLRAALNGAASDGLGLAVAEVDLRVTALLDDGPETEAAPGHSEPDIADGGQAKADSDEERAGQAALSVPGVARLTGSLGGLGRAVHIGERPEGAATLPRRHVRIELAVSGGRRVLDVARDVRTAVTEALADDPSVAVLVTAVS